MVEKGLSHGQGDETSVDHMKDAIKAGHMAMWVVHEGDDIKAALVLSLVETVNGRKVWVEMLAGENMDEWVRDLQDMLVMFRDYVGGHCIEASCREGLAKYLKGLGWKRKAVIMTLET